MNLNLENITKQAKQLCNKENAKKLKEALYNNEASEQEVEKIINSLSEEKKINHAKVLVIIAILMQQGATSPKTPGNKIYSEITVDDLRRHTKLVNDKLTLRRLARSLKQNIAEIILTMGDDAIEGNLAKKMKIEFGEITKEEAVWASDFQTYNENCPIRVRNWLKKNYQDQFR